MIRFAVFFILVSVALSLTARLLDAFAPDTYAALQQLAQYGPWPGAPLLLLGLLIARARYLRGRG